MSKFKIVNLVDRVFISVSIFLIIYAWINFFLRDLWTTFFLSLIFTFACVFLLFYLFNKHTTKKVMNKAYQKDVEEKFLSFQLMNINKKLKFLKSIVEKSCECKKIGYSLVFTKDNQNYQIVVATNIEKLTQFELIKAVSNLKKNIDVLQIICCETDTLLNTKILKNLNIEIVTKKQLYDKFFLPQNSFPDCSNLNTQKDKIKFSNLLKNFFIPSKAKSYFLCGLILIFSSIILPFHVYYLIFGSVLLIFSIACKLQALFKK